MKNEIHKMMDYLCCPSFKVEGDPIVTILQGGGHTSDPSWTATYIYENNKGSFSKTGEINDDAALERIHLELIESCRIKARQNLTDIELANRGLFWCMYEN